MSDAFTAAYRASTSQLEANFIPKTKQEILDLCRSHPENPVARDLLAAVSPYGDDHVHHILPVSIAAVEQNRVVELAWRMEQVRNPVTGQLEYKRMQYLELGRTLSEKGGADDDNEL